jgi:hypothetical protein
MLAFFWRNSDDRRPRRGSGRRRAVALAAVGLSASGGLAAVTTSTASAANSATPAADCQPYSSTPCLFPFPSNLFTQRDPSSSTRLRVHLPLAAMPVNKKGVRVGVAQFDRNDGFSPGSAMVVHVPGLDNATAFKKTGAVGILDMSKEFVKSQPIVVIDQSTGQRQLVYSELDSNTSVPQDTNLMIVPGKDLADGHTYVVALRNLRNSSGQTISAPSWFERLRDGKPLSLRERDQKGRYTRIFAALSKAGISRNNLYEAWNFTVGSRGDLTLRLRSIRNQAFSQLGDHNLADGQAQGHAPPFTVTGTSSVDSGQLTEVDGTFRVPCYLITCGPTAETAFHYSSANPDGTSDPNALPTQSPGNVATAQFECIVPTTATPANPARLSLYGHGLLGSHGEVTAGAEEDLATGHNIALCATDWWGLASGDTPLAVKASGNLNLFPKLVDRLQQGVLNTLFLGRLMRSPTGFASDPAFQSSGQPVVDESHLYYYGNSQGGIEGGLTTAVAPDFTRAALGVTGMDYGNMLIQRSSDFSSFKLLLDAAYPDPSEYPLITDLMQQLWDRGDPAGYAAYMTSNPLPNTPAHQVLILNAYGDHQVSMWAGAAEARTIGAHAVEPALDPVRSRDKNLFYGIPAIPSYPFHGSAIEIWDSGAGRVQPPPTGNVPPTDAPNNNDPHEDPRHTPAAQQQISDFLMPNGAVTQVCGGSPCHSYNYTP